MQEPAKTFENGAEANRDRTPSDAASKDSDARPIAERSVASTHASQAARPRPALKFAYASGSKPLDGYTIKRGIGIGGFGEVYYATSDAGKEVAIKRIQRNLDIELRGVTQCLNLKHSNLLSLFDIKYDSQGEAWVVMEYISGESLQDVVERNPNGLPIDQVRYWFQGIGAGVSYLHDHGIVHRDLKPGNIFMDQNVVKIGDYGLAKFISYSRRSGQTESVGTFHYMAPEIGRGRYGKEIDIYALGILLYELVTGRVPYEGESSQEIIMKHLTAEPDLTSIGEPYRHVIAKALTKDPDHRYSSVAAMLHDLKLDAPVSAGFAPELSPVLAEVADPEARQNDGGFQDKAAEIVTAEIIRPGSPQEPIAKGLKTAARNLQSRWDDSNLNGTTKFLLLAVGIVLLISNVGWIVPICFAMGIVYAFYFVVWAMLTPASPTAMPRPKQSQLAPVVSNPAELRAERKRRAQERIATMNRQLREKESDIKFMEFSGALLMAAFVSAVICIPMLIVGSHGLDRSLQSIGQTYAWMTLTSIIGSWGVLSTSKLWEGIEGDQAIRRFVMLVVGIVTGGAAFGLSKLLLLDPTYVLQGSPVNFPESMYNNIGQPALLAYLGYFGGLMVCLRWWRQADPMRTTRMGIWATITCVVWSIVLHMMLPLPRGFMIAATMSIAIQMSSPWLDQRRYQTEAEGVA